MQIIRVFSFASNHSPFAFCLRLERMGDFYRGGVEKAYKIA